MTPEPLGSSLPDRHSNSHLGTSLSAEARQAIRAEEVYRDEVRAELRKSSQEKQWDLWEVVNSSICIWALSSIVLSLTVWLYNKHEENQRKISQDAEQTKRILLEIKNRWQQADEDLKTHKPPVSADDLGIVRKRLDGKGLKYSIYPDLEPRSLASLLEELESLSESANKSDIDCLLEAWPTEGKEFGNRMDTLKKVISPVVRKAAKKD